MYTYQEIISEMTSDFKLKNTCILKKNFHTTTSKMKSVKESQIFFSDIGTCAYIR